jgi:predicted 3-demethylubiquinone-9 3-methyltransferase (glyoxalase superfamily)
MNNKIIPSLWFCADGGTISSVIEYYRNIFGSDFATAGRTMPLGQTPSGNTKMCQVNIFGQSYLINEYRKGAPSFNDAVAFTINCEDAKTRSISFGIISLVTVRNHNADGAWINMVSAGRFYQEILVN